MRVGQNPLKGNKVEAYKNPLVSLCVLTHWTDHPYHAQRREVVKKCLDTMILGAAPYDFELVVWDNGSSPMFRYWLEEYVAGVKKAGCPAVLVESYNVGIETGRKGLLEIANGRWVAYSDDDIQYRGDWLRKHLEILNVYPAAVVSGSPIRTMFRWATASNARFAANTEGVRVVKGKLLPVEWTRDYAESVGKTYAAIEEANKDVEDVLFEYRGVKAWGHAHHMQFVCDPDDVRPLLEKNRSPMNSQTVRFDGKVDNAGLLRLTTFDQTARHIGNVLVEG